MIISKEVKIPITSNLTSSYIKNELEKMGYKVLRWAITGADGDFYTVSFSTFI